MSYLVDTNIISEVRKGDRCDPNVAAWFESVSDRELYLSVLVIGEIRKGIERARAKMPVQAKALEDWLKAVTTSFAERILPIDRAAAEEWGRIGATRPVSTVDALLAATAKVNGLTLVTRNTADVADLGAKLLNPFEPRR
ncbi:type II toxin-antitoxin system VapC family toxin [Pseudorhodoplanes sp.]|uniref:type II toxin-antitoxin system VapC family toxin n=1 Tax=Pseudorhodoplanes sp. TaxID=1934341 RepID=UPI00391C3583